MPVALAFASPVTAFVNPGPAVTTSPVARAHASAMWTAALSWRVVMTSTPTRSAVEDRGDVPAGEGEYPPDPGRMQRLGHGDPTVALLARAAAEERVTHRHPPCCLTSTSALRRTLPGATAVVASW
jgi:hypothetical protein